MGLIAPTFFSYKINSERQSIQILTTFFFLNSSLVQNKQRIFQQGVVTAHTDNNTMMALIRFWGTKSFTSHPLWLAH